MPRRPFCLATCALFVIGAAGTPPSCEGTPGPEPDQLARQMTAAQVPLEKFTEPLRSQVTRVLQKGQLFERGKPEAFPCKPAVYRWLLDSPDASLYAWKKLGATKASIDRQPDGGFVGTDGQGGELRWRLIATGPKTRVWYAEGSGKMGPLLPTLTVRAVVLLTFSDAQGSDGRSGMKHRLDLFAQYDSGPLVAKLMGMSAESAGKKVLQQVELFFSGMAWYASEHADWTKTVYAQWATSAENKARVKQLFTALEQPEPTPERKKE